MRCKIGYNADISLKIGYNVMFTARIAFSVDFFQSQVPRTKRYLLYVSILFLIGDVLFCEHGKPAHLGVEGINLKIHVTMYLGKRLCNKEE